MALTFTSLAPAPMVKISSLSFVPVSAPPLKSASLILLKLISEAASSLPLAVRSASTASVAVIASPVLTPALIVATEVKAMLFTLTALSVVLILNVSSSVVPLRLASKASTVVRPLTVSCELVLLSVCSAPTIKPPSLPFNSSAL